MLTMVRPGYYIATRKSKPLRVSPRPAVRLPVPVFTSGDMAELQTLMRLGGRLDRDQRKRLKWLLQVFCAPGVITD